MVSASSLSLRLEEAILTSVLAMPVVVVDALPGHRVAGFLASVPVAMRSEVPHNPPLVDLVVECVDAWGERTEKENGLEAGALGKI